jgi:hypothetical protein
MKVLSIDVGIINLGYVYADLKFDNNITISKYSLRQYYLDENFLIEVLDCNRVNITNMKHSVMKFCDCKLHHDYCIPDYLDHFIQEHLEMFDTSDLIIIERQPPMGVTNVQDLLFSKYRHKVVLMNPGRIIKYFTMSRDYSKRKMESEKIASKYLCSFSNFYNNIRKHDISDAMLMLIYYYSTKNRELFKNSIKVVVLDFEQFRFGN